MPQIDHDVAVMVRQYRMRGDDTQADMLRAIANDLDSDDGAVLLALVVHPDLSIQAFVDPAEHAKEGEA